MAGYHYFPSPRKHHTSGCGGVLPHFRVRCLAEGTSCCGVSFAPRGAQPLSPAARWCSLTVEMASATAGSPDLAGNPASPLRSPSHRSGSRFHHGRAGPTSGPEGWRREGGAARVQPIQSTALPPLWPNQEKPASLLRCYPTLSASSLYQYCALNYDCTRPSLDRHFS